TIAVTPPANICPVAVADAYTITQGSPLLVGVAQGVLANDTDADGDTLAALLSADVTVGELLLAADGSFAYAPAPAFVGQVTFSYTAHDGVCSSSPAQVTITVTPPPNTCPVAAPDAYTVTQGGSLIINAAQGVLANDTDADGDALTAQLVANVAKGTLLLVSDGSFAYAPEPAFVGEVTFTYAAHDGTCASTPAAVTITVIRPNAVPVAVADAYSVTAGIPLVVSPLEGVLANDTDADGDALSAQLVENVTHGVLTLLANGGFTYTPGAGFVGEDSFTYRASDGRDTSAPVEVTLTVRAAIFLPLILR
ncbi:MAG: tandem-95 repeat protein, partial [Anaerolineae bacterium]|nr:tandem-95 repeat protein [Anaerolineae bacterium]